MSRDLHRLKRKLLTHANVLDGVNKEARKQNYRLIQALRYAGDLINEKYSDDIFGVFMQGSRIMGYHDLSSDADLRMFYTKTCDYENIKNAVDILEESKKKFEVKEVEIDPLSAAFYADNDIDTEDFLFQFDHSPDFLSTMFGFEISSNPNLLIARLTALRLVAQEPDYDWEFIKEVYNENYLGEMEEANPRIARKFNSQKETVNKILNQEFWKERYRKFTLPEWRKLLAKYEREFRKLKNPNDYIMMQVHESVMSDLEADL